MKYQPLAQSVLLNGFKQSDRAAKRRLHGEPHAQVVLRSGSHAPLVLLESLERRFLLSGVTGGAEEAGICTCATCCGFGDGANELDVLDDWAAEAAHIHDADCGHDLKVDAGGEVIYHDPAPLLPTDDTPGNDPPPAGGGSVGLDEIPELSSNPSSTRKIYLDFNGHTVVNTSWNSGYGGRPIHAPAYTEDSDIFSFTASEITNITQVWEAVAEDFAPFDVDVTTIEPPLSTFTQGRRGIRVLISTNYDHEALGGLGQDWRNPAGGVAYVGSWRWTSDTPVWVFEDHLGNGNDHNVAEASSHEVGHALGLSHDGQSGGVSYYGGHGSGETDWAPIMGVGYSAHITQWSKGEYANATQTQDDLAIITSSNNQVSYRTDDHGNANGGATPLAVDGLNVSGAGIIERNTDVDVFSFTTGQGNVNISIDEIDRGPNLDIEVKLYDDQNNLVTTVNPPTQLGATISMSLSAGTYFLHVDGVGKDTPDIGYSNYASLGQYTITGSIAEVTEPGLINFATETILPYADQDGGGSYAVENGGATLKLQGNAWKRIVIQDVFTPDTILEFDFQSMEQAEIHGIGMDVNNINGDDVRMFQLFGTQTGNAFQSFADYDDDGTPWTAYRIPIGRYYAGYLDNIFFVNDNDAAPSDGVSRFRNVKISESTDPLTPGDFNLDQAIDDFDIDVLAHALRNGYTAAPFNLNGLGTVDSADMDYLIRDILDTNYGDVDLDGDVDTLDISLIVLNFTGANGSSEMGWAAGDHDGDGDVDSADITRAIGNYTGAASSAAGAPSDASLAPPPPTEDDADDEGALAVSETVQRVLEVID